MGGDEPGVWGAVVTIIAAALDPAHRRAVIASDSAGSGWTQAVYGSKFVRLRDDLVVGISGTYLLLRWLREGGAAEVLRAAGAPDPDRLWAAWRTWAKAQGCGHTDTDGNHSVPGTLLVATPTALYTAQSDGAVLQPSEPYAAVGSGDAVALGALAVARTMGLDAGAAATLAVHAAIRHVPTCAGQVHVQGVEEQLGARIAPLAAAAK